MATSTPTKRAAPSSNSQRPAKKGHWSQGLLESMNDPNLIVESDERIVIIKDKYPKARYHFLAIPKINVPNLKALKREQSELLRYMQDQCHLLASKYPHVEFRYGYHAIPSMSQLHLHMISQDFDSPCLKTKRHWNSFNTKYFLDSADVIRCLEERGMVVTMTPIAGEKLLDLPLKCHKCIYSPQNMPKLKQHLYKHSNN
ncbi:aprataxin-like [Portunus trituberculatus]|uniref:Aprataxin n=1 Tax=Portunus trituberculatus TaxID=210409 RepID=A0A5B7DRZ9_PORTR|nr:aprataxin-like [Portunus trituberculatus]MPC23927.1 Aprataxin [Portunus trituberculatus]